MFKDKELSIIKTTLRSKSERCINLPSIISDEKSVGICDTFSCSVSDLFTRRSFLRRQFIISEIHPDVPN